MPFDFDQIIDRRHSNSIKWTAYAEDVLPMWVADMDFGVPQPIQKALHKAVSMASLATKCHRMPC